MIKLIDKISFSKKLFYSTVSIFFVFVTCFILFQYRREKAFKVEILNQKLQVYNESINHYYQLTGKIKKTNPDLRITLINKNGVVEYDSEKDKVTTNHNNRKEVVDAWEKGFGNDVRRLSETTGKKYFYAANRFQDHIIRTALPYKDTLLAEELKIDSHFLWFAFILSLLLIIVFYELIKRLAISIRNLKTFAEQADKDENIDEDFINSFPHNELGDISEHIIRIYKRLRDTKNELHIEKDKLISSQEEKTKLKRQLTQNISHELKTPVSSIQGYLETIVSNPSISEKQKEIFIQRSYAQSNRLSTLLRDISVITRMDEVPEMTEMEPISINNLIETILADEALKIEERKVNIINNLRDGIEILGNHSLLYSIFRNLLDNALSYAGEKIDIQISCTKEDEEFFYFTFSDSGIGIEDKHLSRIFERFYRVDKGRSRKLGGTGLGLAIVKNAVIIHGGIISAHKRKGGGLEFRFTLSKNIKKLK